MKGMRMGGPQMMPPNMNMGGPNMSPPDMNMGPNGMPPNLGKNNPDDPSVMIDGINLNRKEYELVGKIFNKMADKFGQRFSTKSEVVDMFKSEMRQKFNAKIQFEDAKLRGKPEECPMELIACRFAKERPLIFLIIDNSTNCWAIIDEKRFPPLDEQSPFYPVSI